MSDSTGAKTPNPIHKKLLQIKEDIGAIGKDRRGQGISYTFRGIDDLYNALHSAMINRGVLHYPQVVPGTYVRELKDLPTKDGRIRQQTQISYILRVDFVDVDTGEGYFITVPAEGYDDSDKAAGKAVSYGMKTGLAHALGIPTELDPDSERPDTTADPEAVVTALVRKIATAKNAGEVKRLWEEAPAYAKRNPDVIKAKDAAKELHS